MTIPEAGIELSGTLGLPDDPAGLVIFAHGSGSSRLSPRNRAVAAHLNAAGFATLLFDLLTEREAGDRANVFDIDLLASRLLAARRWVAQAPEIHDLPVGLFGASTGAAAALRAAAAAPEGIAAVVSRGGRPDLAGAALRQVKAPTLLIVGGEDREVLELNRRAASLLAGPHELAVVPGAGHLFEEPGALEQAARLAAAGSRTTSPKPLRLDRLACRRTRVAGAPMNPVSDRRPTQAQIAAIRGARNPAHRRRRRPRSAARADRRRARRPARRGLPRHARVLPPARADHEAPDRRVRLRRRRRRRRLARRPSCHPVRPGRQRGRRRRAGAARVSALSHLDVAKRRRARLRRLASRPPRRGQVRRSASSGSTSTASIARSRP